MKQFTIARLVIIDGDPELTVFKEVFNSRAEANAAVKNDISESEGSFFTIEDFSEEPSGKFVCDGNAGLYVEYLVTEHQAA